MEKQNIDKVQPSELRKPEIKKGSEEVKAPHLSSNPINGDFEAEVEKAFFRVFFGIN